MEKKEKDLLLKYLCAALPYGIKVQQNGYPYPLNIDYICPKSSDKCINTSFSSSEIEEVKPYLRSFNSITDEAKEEIAKMSTLVNSITLTNTMSTFLYSNHIDFMGLIDKGLAIEVTEENNPYK